MRVEQLVGELLGHRRARGAARANWTSQRTASVRARRGGHLDGHLVGGAADAAGANLQHRGQRLDARLELLDGGLAAALPDDRQRVVDDLLGDGLLAVQHHLVDDLLDEAIAVDGVRLDRPDRAAARRGISYLAFTPYCERAFLRSLTPAASSVPRITL